METKPVYEAGNKKPPCLTGEDLAKILSQIERILTETGYGELTIVFKKGRLDEGSTVVKWINRSNIS